MVNNLHGQQESRNFMPKKALIILLSDVRIVAKSENQNVCLPAQCPRLLVQIVVKKTKYLLFPEKEQECFAVTVSASNDKKKAPQWRNFLN